MRVRVDCSSPEAGPLQALAKRRVCQLTRRLGWLSQRAVLRLDDSQAGAVDKRCRVELSTSGGRSVIVTCLARDWTTALEVALRRAVRNLIASARPLHRRPAGGSSAVA